MPRHLINGGTSIRVTVVSNNVRFWVVINITSQEKERKPTSSKDVNVLTVFIENYYKI